MHHPSGASMHHPAVREFMIQFFTEDGRPAKGVQTDVANMVGVKPATVSRWFSGSMKIHPSHWPRLAQAAGLVTLDGMPDVEAVACLLESQTDEAKALELMRGVKQSVDRAIDLSVADRRMLEESIARLTSELAALTSLVSDAIAAKASNNHSTHSTHTTRAKSSPSRSSRGSSRSRA